MPASRRTALPLKSLAVAGALAVLCLVGTSGCLAPFHPFGTPVSAAQRQEQTVDQARDKSGSTLLEEAFKTDAAVSAALQGKPNALEAAKQHSSVALSVAGQLFGPPTVIETQSWQSLVDRQTSFDEKIRKLADDEAAKRISQIAKLSQDLDDKSRKLEAAEKKAVDYAAQLQAFKDNVAKVAWIIGSLFALYFLGQFLQLLANFNPAFHTAANTVNALVNPIVHAAATRARKALAAVSSPTA